MILIDSTYIFSGGGKVLLRTFLLQLENASKNYTVLVDDRLYSTGFFLEFPNLSICLIRTSEISRFIFYFNNYKRFSSIFCFASIPPPLYLNKSKVIIYFHNLYFVSNNANVFSFKLYLKKIYIKLISFSSYFWFVQTTVVSKLISDTYNIRKSQIKVMPFFADLTYDFLNKLDDTKIKYVYLADASLHKNHEFLFKNWERFVSIIDSKYKVELHLTLDKSNDFLNKFINNEEYLLKYNIVNHGSISSLESRKLLLECHYLVFVSNFESFGLPLIEASQLGCKIIAPDIDYVNDIIIPSLYFRHNDDFNFVDTLISSLNFHNINPSKLLSKNKIDDILNFL